MPYAFRHATLDNGLTIVAEVDPAAHSAAAGFFVRTGARDEAARDMGVSHFLEHMMFKGTQSLSAEQLNQAFDAIGARNNAFTSNEMTCFYAHVLPEALPRAVELLATMMRPALNQSDFETEKGVILEEIAMYKDNPFWVLYEACVERHFGPHPLSHRVLGTTETITALPRNRMKAYFDDRYAADNTVVAMAGKLDFDRMVDLVAERCGSWRRTGVSRDSSRPALVGSDFTLRDEKVTRGYVLAMCDAPAIADDRRYAAGILAQILGAPDNSRLHWALIEPGIAEEAQASFDAHDGFGEFFVYASGEPDRLEEIWSIVGKQLATLADSLVQEDIDRLLNKFVTGATIGGERPHDRMHRLGRMWTSLGRYMPLEQELDRLSAVTLGDLRAVHEAFPMTPVTIGRLLPSKH
jgi:predicted Zn-dependent peptidase